jgi:hypothetical protein
MWPGMVAYHPIYSGGARRMIRSLRPKLAKVGSHVSQTNTKQNKGDDSASGKIFV